MSIVLGPNYPLVHAVTEDGALIIAVIAKTLELSAHVCTLLADYNKSLSLHSKPKKRQRILS